MRVLCARTADRRLRDWPNAGVLEWAVSGSGYQPGSRDPEVPLGSTWPHTGHIPRPSRTYRFCPAVHEPVRSVLQCSQDMVCRRLYNLSIYRIRAQVWCGVQLTRRLPRSRTRFLHHEHGGVENGGTSPPGVCPVVSAGPVRWFHPSGE